MSTLGLVLTSSVPLTVSFHRLRSSLDAGRLEHAGLDGDLEAGGSVREHDLGALLSGGGVNGLGLGAGLTPRALGGAGDLDSLGRGRGLEGDGDEAATVLLASSLY